MRTWSRVGFGVHEYWAVGVTTCTRTPWLPLRFRFALSPTDSAEAKLEGMFKFSRGFGGHRLANLNLPMLNFTSRMPWRLLLLGAAIGERFGGDRSRVGDRIGARLIRDERQTAGAEFWAATPVSTAAHDDFAIVSASPGTKRKRTRTSTRAGAGIEPTTSRRRTRGFSRRL